MNEINKEIGKEIFFVQGYRYATKLSLVHNISVAKQPSMTTIVGVAATFDF